MESKDISDKKYAIAHDGSGADKVDEIHNRVYMSAYPPTEEYERMNSIGITHIVSIMPGAFEMHKKEGIKYLILDQVKDDDYQNILQYFPQSNTFIREALADNDKNKVLVHCAAGMSRSGAFVTAYLIQECGMNFE